MKSASVKIGGLRRSTPPSVLQTVVWNEELDALRDSPFLNNPNFSAESSAQFCAAVFTAYATSVCGAVSTSRYRNA